MGVVLVVDDDTLNLEIMQAYLEADGLTVRTAHSGERALSAVKASLPDMILLDVRMQDMSGYDVCRRLRADPHTAHLPVLMVTAFTGDEEIQHTLDADADDILFRPVRAPMLALRVRNMLRLGALRSTARPQDDA